MTAKSEKPFPSQLVLNDLFKDVTRIRVLDDGMSQGQPLSSDVLLDVSDPQALTTLQDSLAIIEDPKTFSHCMCLGDYTMELSAGERVVALIGLHHGRSIRWNDWRSDALLQDGMRLLTWLAERGVTDPLERYQEDQRRKEEYKQAAVRWQAAMPKCLQPFWPQMQSGPMGMAVLVPKPIKRPQRHAVDAQIDLFKTGLAPLLQACEAEYHDVNARILALLAWFGSGQGPWSGFPSYEGVAGQLLLTFPLHELMTALTTSPLTPAHLEGAARFFAGYEFNVHRPDDAGQLPGYLKQTLLAHSLASTDQDRIRRAQRAFMD